MQDPNQLDREYVCMCECVSVSVTVYLCVGQSLLAPLAASHHLVIHLHVAASTVLSVTVVTAVRTGSW